GEANAAVRGEQPVNLADPRGVHRVGETGQVPVPDPRAAGVAGEPDLLLERVLVERVLDFHPDRWIAGTAEDLQAGGVDGGVGRGEDAPAEVNRVEQRLLIDLAQRRDEDSLRRAEEVERRVGVVHLWYSDWQCTINISIIIKSQRELPEVAGAL